MISVIQKKREEENVAIIHIYRDRTVYLLLYDSQDTLSTLCKVQVSQALLHIDIHNLQNWKKYCGNSSYLLISSHFSKIHDDQDTLST